MAGDFNCHHPVWNPSSYTKCDQEADRLIELAVNLNLALLLPSGTITFPSKGTATNMLKCGIAVDDDHGSDHLPINTLFSARVEKLPMAPIFNYDKQAVFC